MEKTKMRKINQMAIIVVLAAMLLSLFACDSYSEKTIELANSSVSSSESERSPNQETAVPIPQNEKQIETESRIQTGIIAEQTLKGETGTIHYSYYLPQDYDTNYKYPLMMAMPGYDRMWFGESSSGSNLDWPGFLCWTELSEEIIVVSAQLTDWNKTSANQAIELTEYFINNFSVDQSRVYAAGYSAGGETMSLAVSMRPDLYAAYLHASSRWGGEFRPIVEYGIAVYIFMAEDDEYFGSQRAFDAYEGLYTAYINAGWNEDGIDDVLQIQVPDTAWFAERGVTEDYHGGGNTVFEETSVLNWIVSQRKSN